MAHAPFSILPAASHSQPGASAQDPAGARYTTSSAGVHAHGREEADDLNDLPASAREIAQVIGRDAALRLIGQLPTCLSGAPGKKSSRVMLYVPKKISPDHRLVRILGAEKAMALVKAFGGEVLQPANCRRIFARYRDEAIVKMLKAGASLPMVLSIMRVSRRHVVNLARAHDMTHGQE